MPNIKAQSKVCGYVTFRVENEKFMTAQGKPREDLPAPKVGDSYKAGDDWTTWYPQQAIIPGVHADQPANKEYAGDLKGLFKLDDHAKANGIYEEAKHHQQYQGFLQSKHYQSGTVSCITCHSPHAGREFFFCLGGERSKRYRRICSCAMTISNLEKYMPHRRTPEL